MSVTEIMEPPQLPTPPPGRNGGRIVLWLALGIVAVMAAGTIVAVALVMFGSGTEESNETAAVESNTVESNTVESSTTTSAVTAETTITSAATSSETTDQAAGENSTEASTSTTAASPVAGPRTDREAEELLLTFGEAWRTADWDRMATFASGDVVTTAQEWYSEGGDPQIDQDQLSFIFDSCTLDGAGLTSCTILYAPPEGYGLIFTVVYADNGSGLALDQLIFGGDAG